MRLVAEQAASNVVQRHREEVAEQLSLIERKIDDAAVKGEMQCIWHVLMHDETIAAIKAAGFEVVRLDARTDDTPPRYKIGWRNA
jgi:hypothetical protein